MKASAETAAFHMWFKLMSHPERLTLAGHAAFLIFTVLFRSKALPPKSTEYSEVGSTSFLECPNPLFFYCT